MSSNARASASDSDEQYTLGLGGLQTSEQFIHRGEGATRLLETLQMQQGVLHTAGLNQQLIQLDRVRLLTASSRRIGSVAAAASTSAPSAAASSLLFFTFANMLPSVAA